jgi:glycosyltransferase involved in cell wall biosynthesis
VLCQETSDQRAQVHVTVCVCTFRRPQLLQRGLMALQRMDTKGEFTFSIVVADNDSNQSARTVVEECAKTATIDIAYCVETQQNIALARNQAIRRGRGEFVAFIDDDEWPSEQWLSLMLKTCETCHADGVLGPVVPHFDQVPPTWVVSGRFWERQRYVTGHVVKWEDSRTGNVLFRLSIVEGMAEPFDPRFDNGGEDTDFFKRMTSQGRIFVWCDEAIVYETVPANRLTRSYMMKRGLLRGRIILKHSERRWRYIAISLAAVPVHAALLPVATLRGQHVVMRHLVSLSDHVGRLLAILGLNPISTRDP